MLDAIKSFFGYVKETAVAHPVLFALFILVVPLLVGGLTWKVVTLIRRVPVVGGAVAGAAGTVAGATGSK